jgi:hypothetical protein
MIVVFIRKGSIRPYCKKISKQYTKQQPQNRVMNILQTMSIC